MKHLLERLQLAGAAMEEANAGPGENTRTVKTVHYEPLAATTKCWDQLHAFFFSVPNAYQYRASKYFSERLFRGNAYQVRKLPAGSGTLIPRERLPSLEVAFYA